MTARVLFRCDDAVVPPVLRRSVWDEERPLLSAGIEANLRIGGILDARDVLQRLDGRALDLVRIAAFAYIADRSVSRGRNSDVHGRDWRRTLVLCIPVADHAFWSQDEIRSLLGRLLNGATDDEWIFHFSPSRVSDRQLSLASDPVLRAPLAGSPGCVILFSGGADSLAAAVEAAAAGQRPLLVSHNPSPRHDGRQRRLVEELRKTMPAWGFPTLRFPIHAVGTQTADSTQRSRPFLFASLGAAVAHQLGGIDALLADNGVVSLNLPINEAIQGAYSSRSTHPRVIALFNDLSAKVLRTRPRLSNPLATRTRSEVLATLKRLNCPGLLPLTSSCNRTHGLPKDAPHCGYCSQCVDRRFGALAAGLEDLDPRDAYKLDIFTERLEEGEPRTVALSYVDFARKVRGLTDNQLIEEFPQIYAAVPAEPDVADRIAGEYIDMLRRHADDVRVVMVDMQRRYAADIYDRKIDECSLLRLDAAAGMPTGVEITPSAPDPPPTAAFRRRGKVWEVAFEGRTAHFKHSIGFSHIARLIKQRPTSIKAMNLQLLAYGREVVSEEKGRVSYAEEDSEVNGDGSGTSTQRPRPQKLSDTTAERVNTAEVERLLVEIKRADDDGDVRRSEELNRKLKQLQQQIRRDKRLGGDSRTFGTDETRAQNAASKAIRAAVGAIAKELPSLAMHLQQALTTTNPMKYNPEPSIDWDVALPLGAESEI